MKRKLRTNLWMPAALLAASFSVYGQSANPAVDENFQTWARQGYVTYNGCESASFSSTAPNTIYVTKNYPGGNVTYTLLNAGVSDTCSYKPTTSTSPVVQQCIAASDVTKGYVQLSNQASATAYLRGELITSALENVTTIDLGLSWTGSKRSAVVEKSTDGGATWVQVDSLYGGDCSQYSVTFTDIAVNENNVMLKIKTAYDPNNMVYQRVRIHDLKIYGTIGTSTGVLHTSWEESGIGIKVGDSEVILKSDNLSGNVSIVNLRGIKVGQQEIRKGEEASFAVPSGFYLVRFVSGTKVYSKKVLIQ